MDIIIVRLHLYYYFILFLLTLHSFSFAALFFLLSICKQSSSSLDFKSDITIFVGMPFFSSLAWSCFFNSFLCLIYNFFLASNFLWKSYYGGIFIESFCFSSSSCSSFFSSICFFNLGSTPSFFSSWTYFIYSWASFIFS